MDYGLTVDDPLAEASADEEDQPTWTILKIVGGIVAAIVLVVVSILGVRHANRKARHKGMEEHN